MMEITKYVFFGLLSFIFLLNPALAAQCQPGSNSMQDSTCTAAVVPATQNPVAEVTVNVMHYYNYYDISTNPISGTTAYACPNNGSLISYGFYPITPGFSYGVLYYVCSETFWNNMTGANGSSTYYASLINNIWSPCGNDPASLGSSAIAQGGYCTIRTQVPPFVQIVGTLPSDSIQTTSSPITFNNMELWIQPTTSLGWELVGPAYITSSNSAAATSVAYTWQYDNSAMPALPQAGDLWALGWQITGASNPNAAGSAQQFYAWPPQFYVNQPNANWDTPAYDTNNTAGTYSCGPFYMTVTPNMLGKTCFVTCNGYWNYENGMWNSYPNTSQYSWGGGNWRGYRPSVMCVSQ